MSKRKAAAIGESQKHEPVSSTMPARCLRRAKRFTRDDPRDGNPLGDWSLRTSGAAAAVILLGLLIGPALERPGPSSGSIGLVVVGGFLAGFVGFVLGLVGLATGASNKRRMLSAVWGTSIGLLITALGVLLILVIARGEV